MVKETSDPVFQEIECKFLEVDPTELAKKLEKLGAKREFRRLFKRYVFDFPDQRLHAQKSWVRVRDEGDKVTMTYKKRQGVAPGQSDTGMHEIEIEINNFDHATELLKAIGLEPKFYEENWRTLYRLGEIEFAIDEWPLIPPYIEIESDSWEKVEEATRKLGFNWDDRLVCSTMQVYERYGIHEMGYKYMTHEKQVKK